ncbi:MAG: tetratricopeptide repeat protein [Candidatus Zixiibacteriota bacterium]
MSDKRLRLSQHKKDKNGFKIDLHLEGFGVIRQALSEFEFEISPHDLEDIRWYLEEFLQFPYDPAPLRAKRIEKCMEEIGKELFKYVFKSSDDAFKIWNKISNDLIDTCIEIVTEVEDAVAIPWELIRDPEDNSPLALHTKAFVRASFQAIKEPKIPKTKSGPIRILLVICRPRLKDDVPFRSVASRLIRGLSKTGREIFRLDVLRPPTFEALEKKLGAAQKDGQPYHIVHFDGHGTYCDLNQSDDEVSTDNLSSIKFSDSRKGSHGYLYFENPETEKNYELVNGPDLGKLLYETRVGALVLNACRSAHSDIHLEPEQPDSEVAKTVHERVRAYGSLAQEVLDQGVPGVIAMRHNVYVVTAANYVAELYSHLVQGYKFGEAATAARKYLDKKPNRQIAYNAIPLRDWCVPIVSEAAPIALFPRGIFSINETDDIVGSEDSATIVPSEVDAGLPKHPDVGFFGRDETILALDRAFDKDSVVLLQAFAGSGKTTTAAEFARWYWLTGGVNGPVLFTSFEQYKPLPRVLDQLGQIFDQELQQSGIQWLTLDDNERRRYALEIMRGVPVLWIWDNVEPIAGFPKGNKSAWSDEEQKELKDFLQDAKSTKAKFLITSRRDEHDWLGLLPNRITLPPMPMQERVQLARAIAEKHNIRLERIGHWMPLLRYTDGNPLTITVVVGQAIKSGLTSEKQIEKYVQELRNGEAKFEDNISEGRSRSLGASLNYGFDLAFSEDDKRILALLHLFQGFVDVGALAVMANPDYDWHLPKMNGLTREDGIKLLDRAAEVGLLKSHGGSYYTIHPALPWFFKTMFDKYYPTASESGSESASLRATRAYVESIGDLGNYYTKQYDNGNRDVIYALTAEEANLMHARQLARQHGWWRSIISTMQGLDRLYNHTGRRAEWKRLVEEIVPDFVDPGTDGPLREREEEDWSIVTGYRVYLARDARSYKEAEELQKICVDWDMKRAKHFFDLPPESLDDAQRNAIRTLSVSYHELGQIQRVQGKPECVESYTEALKFAEHIGDQSLAAICAYNLGNCYLDIEEICDFDIAEKYFNQSLEMLIKEDNLGRGKCLGTLGELALRRFIRARDNDRPGKELLQYLNKALGLYHETLKMIPENAIIDLATAHHQLGYIYGKAGDIDNALMHYNQSIYYREQAGDIYGAAQTRNNIAGLLADNGRYVNALDYAKAALQNYKTFGNRAMDKIKKTERLIADIEKAMAKGKK